MKKKYSEFSKELLAKTLLAAIPVISDLIKGKFDQKENE